jgi:hypothetical protein
MEGFRFRSGGSGKEKNLFPLPGIEPRYLCHLARFLVTILNELPRFQMRTRKTFFLVKSIVIWTRFTVYKPPYIWKSLNFWSVDSRSEGKTRRLQQRIQKLFLLCGSAHSQVLELRRCKGNNEPLIHLPETVKISVRRVWPEAASLWHPSTTLSLLSETLYVPGGGSSWSFSFPPVKCRDSPS